MTDQKSESEEIARLICQSLVGDIDPDDRVVPRRSVLTHGDMFVLPEHEVSVPLWRLYQEAADRVIEYFERKEERRSGRA